MPGLERLEFMEVWKDICWALHPLGQTDDKGGERAEDVQVGRLHKVEYSIEIAKI